MMLRHFARISRFRAVGTNGRKQLQTIRTNVRCLALPMAQDVEVSHKFDLGQGYDIYFPAGQDLQSGDRVTIASNVYTVRGVQVFDVPRVGHVHALCERSVSS